MERALRYRLDPKAHRSKKILVVGSPTDPHVSTVLRLCRRSGAETILVSEDSLTSFVFGKTDLNRGSRQDASESDSPTAVWWRFKPGYFRKEEFTSPNWFMRREWQHVLESFEDLFSAAHWINPRLVDRHIRHKPHQLYHAERCGLCVPQTLISNDYNRVIEFIEGQPGRRCIFKPLSWYNERPDRQLFTCIVDLKTIRSKRKAVRRAPGIYQALVPKAYELRITVVKREIFAVRIDSQARPETRIDWRRNQVGIPYSIESSLPAKLTRALLRFHATTGLVYGAHDFIVTPAGEYIFLEVNPVGQWLWLEDATGLKISEAVASALLT